jgi:hypothetical protein
MVEAMCVQKGIEEDQWHSEFVDYNHTGPGFIICLCLFLFKIPWSSYFHMPHLTDETLCAVPGIKSKRLHHPKHHCQKDLPTMM